MLPKIPDLGDFIPTQTLKLESEKLPFKKNISNIKREICTLTHTRTHTCTLALMTQRGETGVFLRALLMWTFLLLCVSRVVNKKMGLCENDLGSHHSLDIQC